MATNKSNQITLEDARLLVELLEKGEQAQADEIVESLSRDSSEELFAEVGKLTRQLHDSLNSFQLDGRLADLTKEEIPDAQSRLTYVIETTEEAANNTMDAVEQCMPIAESMQQGVQDILPGESEKGYVLGHRPFLCGRRCGRLAGRSVLQVLLQGYHYRPLQCSKRACSCPPSILSSMLLCGFPFGEHIVANLLGDGPFLLFLIARWLQLWNRDWTHHGIDSDHEEIALADDTRFPIGFCHGTSGDLHTCCVGAREYNPSCDFNQIALSGWSLECQCINGNSDEFPMGKFGASNTCCFVHDRE